MKSFKTQAHIHSLDGAMDEITVLKEIGDNNYLVDYHLSSITLSDDFSAQIQTCSSSPV